MRGFLFVLVVLVAVVVCLGFYQGWFHVSSDKSDSQSNIKFTYDGDKVKEDTEKAKEKIHDLGPKAKDKAGEQSGKSKEQDPQQ